jgi:sensor histidine kinase YesM
MSSFGETIIKNLAQMHRMILNLSGTDRISIQDELTLIQSYLEVEKARLKDRLKYSISISEDLRKEMIVPLIIEPLVENAVKHGIAKKAAGGQLDIHISKENGFLIIVVDDNGTGFVIEKMNPGEGIFNIQERLKLYYHHQASLKMNSTPGMGTKVTLTLPAE